MKNNFLQEAYGGLREARSKHYCLGLPRKWKVITSTLLLLFTFAIGNVWGAAGDATTSNAPKSGGTSKDYANTISVAAGYLDGNVMYYISNNLTFISTDGLEANYLGFVFKPSVDLTIDFEGFNGNSGDVNITYQIDSIADAAFYEVFTEAGSNKISEKIISDNGGESASSTHTVLNYWKDNGVVKYSSKKWQSNGDNAPKNLAGQQNTTYFGNTRLVTDKVVAISSTKSAAAGTYSFMRDATNKFVFKAGKVYRIYSTRGSSKTGYKSFTFTPVYQLTWALDGGSITSAADAYTNAGYYAKGTELTAPTVTKAGADFAGWSPALAATMPAAATTYTAQWTAACTKPGTPGTPSAGSTATHNSATLTWTAADNSDGYKVSIVKKSDASVVLDWTNCATNSYAASGLDAETTYTFKVKAKGATGYCELGDEASADFATVADPSATTYKVTLVPAGGTISDATGWTLNAGNYEKEVSEGTVLTLPTFTKENRTFKTWRNGVPADVESPITVTGDVTLTAVWNATVDNVLYYWAGAQGGATEVGGTAATVSSGTDNFINVAKAGYYCLQISGGTSYDKYVEITLSGEEKVKTGDKIRYTGFYTNTGTKNAAIKMRTSGGTAIFTGANLPRIETASPRTDTYTVETDGINASAVQITRHQTQTSSWIPMIQILRPTLVEEANVRTVTFNYNDGGATASTTINVASGSTVYAEVAPTYAHHRFNGWKLNSAAYDFSTAVTADITLVADWTQLYR